MSILQEQFKQSADDRTKLHETIEGITELIQASKEESIKARLTALSTFIAVLVGIVVAFAQAIVMHGGFHGP